MKLKKLLAVALSLLSLMLLGGCGGSEKKAADAPPPKAAPAETKKAEAAGKKPLVVYFSWSPAKNTERVAKEIRQLTNADIFRVETVKPYSTNYQECVDYAKAEKQRNEHPEIKGSVANIADYDMIFIGYPIWWYDAPMAIYSFIDKHNLDGKKIAVFATSGGSPVEQTMPLVKKALPKSTVVEPGLLANGSGEVAPWLNQIGWKKQ